MKKNTNDHRTILTNGVQYKNILFKIMITLLSLSAAVAPWILLIARVSINGID